MNKEREALKKLKKYFEEYDMPRIPIQIEQGNEEPPFQTIRGIYPLEFIDQALATPQQKTFTLDEVRDFINTHFNVMGFLKLPCKIKNVGCYNANRDCRECLLSEFEKVGGING